MPARRPFDRVRPPLQERSRETLEAILVAAEVLLDGRPFEAISIEEIINRAEVSRSSFYARFPTKEALLPELFRRYTERARSAFTAATSAPSPTATPEAVVEGLVRGYLGFFRRFQLPTTTFDGAGLDTHRDALQAEVIRGVVTLYCSSVDRVGDSVLAAQVEFAARSAGAILLRAIGPPQRFAEQLGYDDDRLVREVTRMVAGYLAAVRA